MSVGERLKAAREQKGIVMEEACRVTKVQRRILEAIEQNRLPEMLDPAYARIFLKRYAGFLGVDGAALVEEYLSAQGETARSAPPSPTDLSIVTRARAPQVGQAGPPDLRPLAVGLGAGLAALVGIGFLVYLGMDLASNLRESRRVPAPAPQARQEKPPAERPLVVPLSKKLQLSVQTSANVWLQVKSDGSVIFQNILPKGSRESWTAQRELELWTGNASAMALTLNGKPLEGLGRGVKKGIRITHAGMEQP